MDRFTGETPVLRLCDKRSISQRPNNRGGTLADGSTVNAEGRALREVERFVVYLAGRLQEEGIGERTLSTTVRGGEAFIGSRDRWVLHGRFGPFSTHRSVARSTRG